MSNFDPQKELLHELERRDTEIVRDMQRLRSWMDRQTASAMREAEDTAAATMTMTCGALQNSANEFDALCKLLAQVRQQRRTVKEIFRIAEKEEDARYASENPPAERNESGALRPRTR